MSCSVYLFSEHDGPFRINASDDVDAPVIWIKTREFGTSIGISMDARDRAALRAALDELDARESARSAEAVAA